jgi:hypothetical protein
MIEGFYRIAFTGAAGSGFGILVLCKGAVAGADVAGGTYDGSYKEQKDTIELNVTMRAPAGVALVQNGIPLTVPIALPFKTSLPHDLGSGTPILVNMPPGPVNVVFVKISDFPV